MMSDDTKNSSYLNGAEVLLAASSGSGASSSGSWRGSFQIYNTPATPSDLHTQTYATVLAGTWTAYASNGHTLYASGGSVVSGPINLGYGANLDIKSGAVVSGIQGGGSYQFPNITIESGGTLENSILENGWVTISSGGVSYRNLYDSTVGSNFGTSINDTIYTSYGYDLASPMTVYSGGTAADTLVSSGGKLIISSGGSGLDLHGEDSGYISGAPSSYISGYRIRGSSYIAGYGTINAGGTASTEHSGGTLLTGTWSAVYSKGTNYYDYGNQTVYVSSGATVTGQVALGSNAVLYVKSGATATNVNAVSNSLATIYVSSGGTLQSSTLPNGWLTVYSGGASIDNNLNSDPITYYSGATSIRDTIYDSGYTAGDAAAVYSGATIESAFISSGGILNTYSGAVVSDINQAGGTFTQTAGGSGATLTGVWSAVYSGGTTVYQSGTNIKHGNVTLGQYATLYVLSGADANNVQTGYNALASFIVSSGGTLSNSYANNCYLTISSGGTGIGNIYNSVPVNIKSGAVDSAGTYYNSGYYDYDGGVASSGATVIDDVLSGNTGYLTISSGATVLGGTVVSGGTLTIRDGAVVSGGTIAADGYANDVGTVSSDMHVSNGGVLYETGSGYNSDAVAARPSITLPSNPIVLPYGTWVAVKSNGAVLYESAYSSGGYLYSSATTASGGSLVYLGRASSSGTTIVNGNVALGNWVTLEISSGVTISGLNTISAGKASVYLDSGATLISSYIADGYLYIASGAVASGNAYNSTPAYVASGGVDKDGTQYNINYDAIQGATAYSGGTIINPYISTGGTLKQSSGGTIINPTIVSGGVFQPQSGGLPLPSSASTLLGSWTAQQSNGTIYYQSAYSSGQRGVQLYSNGVLISGATPQSSGTTTVTGPVSLSGGGTLEILSGATVSGLNTTSGGIATVVIDSGATLVSSYIENGYVSIGSGGVGLSNVYNSVPVYVSSGGVDANGSYYNYIFYYGDGATAYNGGVVVNPYVSNGGTVTAVSGGTLINPKAVGGGRIYVTSGGTLNTCFLEGTMIQTPQGKKPVETLTPGDEVVTFKEGQEACQKIHWVGVGRASFAHHGGVSPANIEDYPIRIRKDAFGKNLPYKDLLLTSEHCLYFEGSFLPARMLVNGRSILYDVALDDYLYYHLETEEHSVIYADGVRSESYLDTGNRSTFDHAQYFLENFEECVQQRGARSWQNDAAFPLNVARDFVEPLWRTFDERAQKMGLEKQFLPWEEPEEENSAFSRACQSLLLMTEKREALYPLRETNGYLLFELPKESCELRLRSPIRRPVDVIGPFIDDRRHLGALVGEIKLISEDKEIILKEHLENEALEGWNNIENALCRWTAGNALIPLPPHEFSDDVKLLALQIIDRCG